MKVENHAAPFRQLAHPERQQEQKLVLRPEAEEVEEQRDDEQLQELASVPE